MKTLIVLSLLAAFISGCGKLPRLDQVLPDKRTEYRSARDLPPLEVPPDLTTDTINNSMAIPGEETPNTLSAYERQQRRAAESSALGGPLENEDSLTLRGDRFTVWPDLKRFWQDQGFVLELDDAELGVLETGWSEPRDTDAGQVRDKFKVFAESGNQEDTTLLFISHDLQRRSSAGGEWQDAGSDAETRQAVTAAMYEFFGGQPAGGGTQVADSGDSGSSGNDAGASQRRSNVPRAEIINNDEGQVHMLLPDDYETAWAAAENAMVNIGMEIRSTDNDKGEFVVAYKPPQNEEDKGWFDALKFWKDDDPAVYRISLTSVDDRTELVVHDEDGEWLPGDEARDLLNRIQLQYNR